MCGTVVVLVNVLTGVYFTLIRNMQNRQLHSQSRGLCDQRTSVHAQSGTL